ncbi:MAG: hypothetical protein CSA20_06575 [Deltaproteobacteria bacterium]|nr:MAG: hypothetical protein CSA20_06575 [Deltaproteobacteria bacterium]
MKKTILVLIGLFLVLLATGLFLVGTSSGLVALQKLANSLAGDRISIARVQGHLGGTFAVDGISISTEAADLEIGGISCLWRPSALFEGLLDIRRCELRDVSINLTPQAGNGQSSSSLGLPLAVDLQRFSLSNLRILERGKLLQTIDECTASVLWKQRHLQIRNLSCTAPEFATKLQLEAKEEKEWNLALNGSWNLHGFGFHPSQGTLVAGGGVSELQVEAKLTSPGAIQVRGVIRDLLENPRWQADVSAQNVDLERWIEYCPQIILASVRGKMHGNFQQYKGLVEAEGYWGLADALQLEGEIVGDGLGIDFTSLTIRRKGASVSTKGGRISWEKIFSWRADLDVDNFALSLFFPENDTLISGRLHSAGDVLEEGLLADLNLQSVSATSAGYPWSVLGDLTLTESGLFSQDLRFTSSSSEGEVKVHDFAYLWDEPMHGRLLAEIKGFNPGVFHPLAAGQIEGNLQTKLHWPGEFPVISLQLGDLAGSIRGRSFAGEGALVAHGSQIENAQLQLSLGSSRLAATGSMQESLDLRFTLEAPDLQVFGPELAGEITAEGSVSGKLTEPALELRILGGDLCYDKASIASLEGYLQGGFTDTSPFTGELSASGVKLDSLALERCSARLSGTLEQHLLVLNTSGSVGSFSSRLTGGLQEGWRGLVDTTVLEIPGLGSWRQETATALTTTADLLALERFCLVDDSDTERARACFSAKAALKEAMDWQLSAQLRNISAKYLSHFSAGIPRLAGVVQAELEASGDRDALLEASGRVDIPTLDTILPSGDSDSVSLHLRDAYLRCTVEEEVLNLNAVIKQKQPGSLQLQAKISDFGRFEESLFTLPITGNIVLDGYDVEPLAALTEYMIQPSGRAHGNFQLNGSLAAPVLQGELLLQDGDLELPLLGIHLTDVGLLVDAREHDAQVRASVTSGEGSITAQGRFGSGADGPELSVHLKGSDFLLVNLPEYRLKINPDAKLTVNKKALSLQGKTVVPSGIIAPEELTDMVTSSEDVVLIQADNTADTGSYPITLDLDVILGDDVRIEGYGLKGRVGGQILVKSLPNEFVTAEGELTLLESTFTLYSTSLDIERGRILFSGGPIDNPGVDIRAQKTISDETASDQEHTVGVDISGILQDLKFQLFSDPHMDDTDILSQMVVGHSFNSSSQEETNLLQAAATKLGIVGGSRLMQELTDFLFIDEFHLEGSARKEDLSLVVGKRIAKRLYIGYDMNMYSQLGQFRVRYELGRGFYVETKSSSVSTGADLFYSFEN